LIKSFLSSGFAGIFEILFILYTLYILYISIGIITSGIVGSRRRRRTLWRWLFGRRWGGWLFGRR
jgi:hypothetical protein